MTLQNAYLISHLRRNLYQPKIAKELNLLFIFFPLPLPSGSYYVPLTHSVFNHETFFKAPLLALSQLTVWYLEWCRRLEREGGETEREREREGRGRAETEREIERHEDADKQKLHKYDSYLLNDIMESSQRDNQTHTQHINLQSINPSQCTVQYMSFLAWSQYKQYFEDNGRHLKYM